MLAVGSHDQRGGLGDRLTARGLTADAYGPAVGDECLVDVEMLANLGARGPGGVDQDRVEDGAARAVQGVDA